MDIKIRTIPDGEPYVVRLVEPLTSTEQVHQQLAQQIGKPPSSLLHVGTESPHGCHAGDAPLHDVVKLYFATRPPYAASTAARLGDRLHNVLDAALRDNARAPTAIQTLCAAASKHQALAAEHVKLARFTFMIMRGRIEHLEAALRKKQSTIASADASLFAQAVAAAKTHKLFDVTWHETIVGLDGLAARLEPPAAGIDETLAVVSNRVAGLRASRERLTVHEQQLARYEALRARVNESADALRTIDEQMRAEAARSPAHFNARQYQARAVECARAMDAAIDELFALKNHEDMVSDAWPHIATLVDCDKILSEVVRCVDARREYVDRVCEIVNVIACVASIREALDATNAALSAAAFRWQTDASRTPVVPKPDMTFTCSAQPILDRIPFNDLDVHALANELFTNHRELFSRTVLRSRPREANDAVRKIKELEQSVDEMHRTVRTTQDRHRSLEDKIKELEEQNRILTVERERALRAAQLHKEEHELCKSTLQQDLLVQLERIKELEQQLDASNELAKQREAEAEALRAQLSGEFEVLHNEEDLERELANVRSELEGKAAELETARTELGAARERVDKLEAELAAAAATHHELDTLRASLERVTVDSQGEMSILSQTIAELRDRLTTATTKESEANDVVRSLRSELDDKTSRLHSLDLEVEELRAELKQAHADLVERDREGAALRRQQAETAALLANLRIRESDLSTDLATMLQTKVQLEDALAASEKANEELRGAVAALEADVAALKQAIQQSGALTESVAALRRECAALKEQNESCVKDKDALGQQLQSLRDTVASMERDKAALAAARDSVQRQLDEVQRAAQQLQQNTRALEQQIELTKQQAKFVAVSVHDASVALRDSLELAKTLAEALGRFVLEPHRLALAIAEPVPPLAPAADALDPADELAALSQLVQYARDKPAKVIAEALAEAATHLADKLLVNVGDRVTLNDTLVFLRRNGTNQWGVLTAKLNQPDQRHVYLADASVEHLIADARRRRAIAGEPDMLIGRVIQIESDGPEDAVTCEAVEGL